MPKRKFPKFENFSKVSKMKFFCRNCYFCKIFYKSVKNQKHLTAIFFSETLVLQSFLKNVKNKNNFEENVNFAKFFEKMSKIKIFLKKLSNFRTIISFTRIAKFDPKTDPFDLIGYLIQKQLSKYQFG